jgi:hypothetical protein
MKKNMLIEDLFVKAARRAQNLEMGALEKELQLSGPHIFSESFRLKMEKLLKFSHKPYFSFVNTVGKRIAIIAILIAVSFSVIMVKVEAVRDPVIHFIVEIYEKFSSIIFPDSESEEGYPDRIEKSYEPGYIPEGYALAESTAMTAVAQLIFSNQAGEEIVFMQYAIRSSSLSVDTEGVDIHKILIGDKQALFYSNKGVNNLIWTDGEYGYKITGSIQQDETIKMMESIRIKK